jgi:hypothetical protein
MSRLEGLFQTGRHDSDGHAEKRDGYPFCPKGPALFTIGYVKSICVYCGSSAGTDPAFAAAAQDVGEMLARNGIRLVYGGGRVGLRGELGTRRWGRGRRRRPAGLVQPRGSA